MMRCNRNFEAIISTVIKNHPSECQFGPNPVFRALKEWKKGH